MGIYGAGWLLYFCSVKKEKQVEKNPTLNGVVLYGVIDLSGIRSTDR